jgi:ATP-binding cassette subfamily B protein
LSHGERSRVFAARALLQNPDVLILDESFAALDARTVEQSLRVILERTPTLVMIAHP